MTKFRHKQSSTYTWPALPWENQMMNIKNFHKSRPINNMFFCTWNFDGGFQLIFFCKWQQLYLGLIYQKFVKNPYYSYIFNFNPGQNLNFFYGNFCLKLFKLKLKVTCYNLLFWPMANRKWSKHRFHWYMVIVMLWKDLEVPVKLEERRTFTENGGWLFITR